MCFVSLYFQALRSDSAADGQSLGETRKQLKEETLLRLVGFRLLTMFFLLCVYISVSFWII